MIELDEFDRNKLLLCRKDVCHCAFLLDQEEAQVPSMAFSGYIAADKGRPDFPWCGERSAVAALRCGVEGVAILRGEIGATAACNCLE